MHWDGSRVLASGGRARRGTAGRSDGFGSWATAGLHPHEASLGAAASTRSTSRDRPGPTSSTPASIVAVGECGLDYHYDHSPRDAQRTAFEAQIALAAQHGLTLVVHTRSAWDDTIDILRSCRVSRAGRHPLLHRRSTGGEALSRSRCVPFVQRHRHLQRRTRGSRRCGRCARAERLLVETDAPFLAPVPYRGKPNRPAWVAVVGEAVAEARGESPADLRCNRRPASLRVRGIRSSTLNAKAVAASSAPWGLMTLSRLRGAPHARFHMGSVRAGHSDRTSSSTRTRSAASPGFRELVPGALSSRSVQGSAP